VQSRTREIDSPNRQTQISDHADIQSLFGPSRLDAVIFSLYELLIVQAIDHDRADCTQKHTESDSRERQTILPETEVVMSHEDDRVSFEESKQDAESKGIVDGVHKYDWLKAEHLQRAEENYGE
jgi:hypothetical protein